MRNDEVPDVRDKQNLHFIYTFSKLALGRVFVERSSSPSFRKQSWENLEREMILMMIYLSPIYKCCSLVGGLRVGNLRMEAT